MCVRVWVNGCGSSYIALPTKQHPHDTIISFVGGNSCKYIVCSTSSNYLFLINLVAIHYLLVCAGKLLKSIGKKAKWLIGPVRNVWNRLKTRGPRFLRDSDLPQFLGGVVRSKVQGRIRSYVEGLPQQLKKYWTGFVEWIVSIDPVSYQFSCTYAML